MVELLISISIVVVSLLGIFTLLNRALGLNRVNAEQYVASYLASEGIEVTKNIFDRGFYTAGAGDFYSQTDFQNYAPGVYQVEFDSKTLTPVCSFPPSGPTEGAVRSLFENCSDAGFKFLEFDAGNGLYSYNLSGVTVAPTKFKRLIIVDAPNEFAFSPGAALDFRITSAVGWKSRGGSFVVQLQDHFLPWRIPQ